MTKVTLKRDHLVYDVVFEAGEVTRVMSNYPERTIPDTQVWVKNYVGLNPHLNVKTPMVIGLIAEAEATLALK